MRRALWGALLLVIACNSSKQATGTDGGGGASGDSGGAGGTSSGGSSGDDSGVCANVACLQTAWDMTLACEASGSCSDQATATPLTEASCYDNGVHVLSTFETSTGATTSTVTSTFKVNKNGTLCFTKIAVDVFPAGADAGADAGANAIGNVTTMDPSGTLVATVHVEGGVTTVTCPGGPPTVLPDSCGFSGIMVTGAYLRDATASTCNAGTCSF
jgi:hypothetical protein